MRKRNPDFVRKVSAPFPLYGVEASSLRVKTAQPKPNMKQPMPTNVAQATNAGAVVALTSSARNSTAASLPSKAAGSPVP